MDMIISSAIICTTNIQVYYIWTNIFLMLWGWHVQSIVYAVDQETSDVIIQ